MSVKTIMAWIDGEARTIEVEVTEEIVPEPTIEDRIFALEHIQSPEFISNVTLLATKWTGNTSPYSQVVNLNGITSRSKIDLQPNTEQLAIFYKKDLAFVAENDNGVVTVFCIGQKPTNDYTIQATITEVVVNE
jgi:hypothetical protein